MRFIPQNVSDHTGAFDVELVGFGRIAHVDPWGVDDTTAFRNLICSAPDMLAALELAELFMSGFEGDEMQDDMPAHLATIRAAIAKARGERA
jgi:hypothetical protein